MAEPAKDEKKQKPLPAPSKALRSRAVPIAIAVFVLLLLGAWLMRGTIATSIAKGELEARGLTCDERFAVEPAAFFGSATIAATRCSRADGGLVEALELVAPATVQLDGFAVASVSAENVRLVLRDQDVRGGSEWASELQRLNLEQRVAGLIKGLSELSALDLPPTSIARAEVLRGGEEMCTIEGMGLVPGESLGLTIERVSFIAVLGAAQLTLSALTGTATRPSVHLEGQALARAGFALLGSFSTGGPFTLDATRLDTAQPQFRLRADF